MKAVVITSPGGPEVLQLQERNQPVPLANEVLVKVAAAGINRPDVAQRKGNYPPPPGASPDIPGLEIAGTVVHVGPNCSKLKVGDKICALVSGGGYAEFCAVPEIQCLRIPANLSWVEAASLPETFFTVWSNVFDRGRLLTGESFLVHGGSGGIGVTAIQMARAFGATVYATAGSAEKCSFCEDLGAKSCINYKTEDFVDAIKKISGGKGVDVILDMVGGEYTSRNLDLLAPEGRLVQINFVKGDEVTVKLGLVMRKCLTITGSMLRSRDPAFKGMIAVQLEQKVWPEIEKGAIKPAIYRTFPLGKASDAHTVMESGSHLGKIVLEV